MNCDQTVLAFLSQIKDEFKAHFSAIALWIPEQSVICWVYAVGNRNERYRRIRLRLGKGIAGKVIVSGKPMILQNFKVSNDSDSRDYPILYAEALISVMGLPVFQGEHVRGVLLVGYRSLTAITDHQVDQGEKLAEGLAKILDETHGW